MESLLKLTKNNGTPGLTAQTAAAMLILFPEERISNCEVADIMINSCLQCEGVKGRPEIIHRAIEMNPWIKEHERYMELERWVNTYVKPVILCQDAEELRFMSGLPSSPKLMPCSFPHCRTYCCYDGVYLRPGEEEKIVEFVGKHLELFPNLPNEYIVDGNWMNIVSGRKTATRVFRYEKDDFPSHFNHTRCVMCDEQGYCSLQKAAIQLDLHPWHVKPIGCWTFPLGVWEGCIVLPPRKGEPDPEYVDESHPGYITFLPCGKDNEDGIAWSKLLRQEYIYIEHIIKKSPPARAPKKADPRYVRSHDLHHSLVSFLFALGAYK